MKRVLYISGNTKWRGSEEVVNDLFNYTSDIFEHYLFCPEHSELYTKNDLKKANIFVFKKNWIYILTAAYRLKKICAAYNINLIHLNDSRSVNIFIAAGFLGLNVPAVLHRHVNIPITNTLKYNYHKIIQLFCVSKQVKVTASKTINEKRLTVVYPGIKIIQYTHKQNRTESFLKKMFDIPADAKIIGIISAMVKEKNITEFIEIANRCHEQNKNYHFVLVGDGKLYDSYKKEYSSDYIHFTGFLKNINDVLSCFEIFLFTSQNEGFGLVLVEAMAAKVPVISNYFPSVNELIEQEKTGFIYKDINDAVAKTTLLITNETLRNNITTNAWKFVQQFDVTLMCKQTEEKYTELLNQPT